MSDNKIKLKSPNENKIVGIKLNDGSISEFEYIRNGDTYLYSLPDGNASKVDNSSGDSILVDSKGQEWSSSEVEFCSLFFSQN